MKAKGVLEKKETFSGEVEKSEIDSIWNRYEERSV